MTEPVPAGVDCWAQGSVPRTVFITNNMPAIDRTIAEEAEEMAAMTREASEGLVMVFILIKFMEFVLVQPLLNLLLLV